MSSKSWRRLSDIYNIFDKDYIVGTIKVLTFATVAAVVKNRRRSNHGIFDNEYIVVMAPFLWFWVVLSR